MGLGKAEHKAALAENKQPLQGISGHQKLSAWILQNEVGAAPVFISVVQTNVSSYFTRLLPMTLMNPMTMMLLSWLLEMPFRFHQPGINPARFGLDAVTEISSWDV